MGADPGGLVNETPIFTQDREFLRKMIPQQERFLPTATSQGASIYDCG